LRSFVGLLLGDVLSYEEERKLKVVAARRLLIVEGIYQVWPCHDMRSSSGLIRITMRHCPLFSVLLQLFSALLFSSECLSSRFSVIIGSRWVRYYYYFCCMSGTH